MSNEIQQQSSHESADLGFTASNFFHELSERKRLVALIFALPIILALATVSLSTRYYKATTVVVPIADEGANLGALAGELGGIAAMLGAGTIGSSSSKEESLAVLKSRSFLAKFLVESDALAHIRDRVWPNGVRVGIPVFGGRRDMVVSDAVEYFRTKVLNVSEDRFSGVIRISLEWPDREVVGGWANLLVNQLNLFSRDTAMREAKTSLEYLNEEVSSTTQLELRNSLFTLIENQKHKQMLATVREEYVFKVIDPAIAPQADQFTRPRPFRAILLGIAMGIVLTIISIAWLVTREEL